MRILAFGDIHGCLAAFDALLNLVAPVSHDLLVTLGDHIDRGPDSCGVVERLLEQHARHRMVSLCGNHEQMILEARQSPAVYDSWLMYGGAATLKSYSRSGRAGHFDDIPEEHWDFFERDCLDWFETDRHFFVHAGAFPDLALDEQPLYMLRWEKFHAPHPHVSGKVMICGHTRQLNGLPRNVGHAVCIDTWVYGQGWLTCLDALSGHFWQANQRGETREGELAALLEAAPSVEGYD